MKWMNLLYIRQNEPIIQSVVGQKEKDKYRILTHTYGIQKNNTEEFIYRAATEKQTENRLIDTVRGEERVRCMGRVTWKLILPYVKQIANRNLLYGSGNSNRGSVSTKRGEMGRGMERNFKREEIYVYLWLIQRRQWHPTPVLLPGKSHGRRSLVGCGPWGR